MENWGIKQPGLMGGRWGSIRVQGQIYRWAVLSGCLTVSFAFLCLLIFTLSLSLCHYVYYKASKLNRNFKIIILARPFYLFISNCVVLSDFILRSLSIPESGSLLFYVLTSFCLYFIAVPAFVSFSETLSHSPQASVSKPVLYMKGYWKTLDYARNGWVGIFPHESRCSLGSGNKG